MVRDGENTAAQGIPPSLISIFLSKEISRSLSDIRKHENFGARIWLRINDLDIATVILIPPIGHFRQCRTGS